MHMGTTAMSPKMLDAFAFAYPFMEVAGDVVMAWMLLWRAAIAAPELARICGDEEPAAKAEKNKDAAFYLGQIPGSRWLVTQAKRFGAEILSATDVVGLRVKDQYRIVTLKDGTELTCKALLLVN